MARITKENQSSPPLILTTEDLERELRIFSSRLSIYSPRERKLILDALFWSRSLHKGQMRESGEPYIIHPVRTAETLIEIKADYVSVIAALLHDVLEDTQASQAEVNERFDTSVGSLVQGVTKIDFMKVGSNYKTASLRKMIWAMVDDIRVIFIKLADKCHNMHTLDYIAEPARRRRIACECLEIFAPMAGKLGMSSLRNELEDLSLKYLKPDAYRQISEHVNQKRAERAQHLVQIQQRLTRSARDARIKMKISTRAKHFYSIYRKMKNRNKSLEEIYDLLGVRIICETQSECYIILGLVHSLWMPLEGKFKDYIARPKSNGYQSLHTSVLTDWGQPLEIQIRSTQMNETAEFGVAAHLFYKEGENSAKIHPDQLAVVQQLRILKDESSRSDSINDENDFLETIKRDVLRDSIIVYTPKGDPVEMPEGSTAIDMAYHIHSEIGEHCAGAKADGVIIPLTRPLKNAQMVEILTSPRAHPHINWLKHIRSTRVRTKIRNWLNHHDSNVIIDRNIVARNMPARTAPQIAPTQNKKAPTQKKSALPAPSRQKISKIPASITVKNESNMMIKISICCSPIPGDRIIGYVSPGRGIVVHKLNCPNIKGIPNLRKRQIHVEWENTSSTFIQGMRIHSRYTHELFSEIERAIRKYKGHLIAGSLSETDRGELEGFFTMEIENKKDFNKIYRSINSIPSVLSISRLQDPEKYYH